MSEMSILLEGWNGSFYEYPSWSDNNIYDWLHSSIWLINQPRVYCEAYFSNDYLSSHMGIVCDLSSFMNVEFDYGVKELFCVKMVFNFIEK